MPITRIPLTQPIESRTSSFAKDSRCVNGYFETRDQSKREFIKRPGLQSQTLAPAIPAGDAQGLTYFNGYLYAIVNNVVYQVDPISYTVTTVGTMTGAIQNCSMVQTMNNAYLFIQNGTNGYLLSSSGSFTQITNDTVATVTVLTGGSGYSNGTTVTFTGSCTTPATASITAVNGVIIGVTILTKGLGYTTAPTVSFTPAATVSSATVSNTSGSSIMTASTGIGSLYVGMTVSGAGVNAGTTITALSSTGGTYTITLSSTTTANVTTATFTDAGNGATATSLLNFFPTNLVPGAVFLDSYVFVATQGGRIYSSAVGDPTIWNPLDYITAESEPDNLVGIVKHFNYILGLGQWSTDFFYDGGNATGSPLAVASSYKSEIGCANGASIVQFEQSVIWIGRSKSEGPQVFLMDGTSPVKVSTVYIDRWLQKANALDTIDAYVFKMNGHTFYVLTLHGINTTLVFDINEKMWYNWSMWTLGNADTGAVDGVYGEQYFRASYYTTDGTSYFMLDDDTGKLYKLSSDYYTDDGAPIYYRCVSDIIDSGTTKRKFYTRLEIVGDKIPATMMVRHSNDDYQTWSSYRQVDLSKPRAQIYQLGEARRRAWEFLCTDAVPLRLDAAEIDFSIGELEQDGATPTNYRR